jgi:thiol-disulfide isomerase/thioredoxin
MNIRFLLSLLVFCTLLLGGIAWWVNHRYHEKAPAGLWQAEFIDIKGKVQKISRPHQRPLVVNFWASWCGPCRDELPELAELALLFREQVDFVGIAVDNKAAVASFLLTTQVPYPILLGQADTLALMKAEGNTIGGLPFTLVYTANGHLMMTKAGKIHKEALKKQLQHALASPR